MRILILLSAITLVSCGTTVAPVRLVLPPPLDYPTIESKALECLSPSAYRQMVVRDKLKTKRIETLRNIIKSTH